MLLPSTRRLALLSLLALFAIALCIRNSPYLANLNYDKIYSLQRPISGISKDGFALAPGVDEVPLNKPNQETPTTTRGPAGWYGMASVQTPTSTPSKPSPTSTEADALADLSWKDYMKKMLQWGRPGHDDWHWPPYEDFIGKSYDPNRWEEFPLEKDFFETGINELKRKSLDPMPYLPYPDYFSDEYKEKWRGDYAVCKGARGKYLNQSVDDMVLAYQGVPEDFPTPSIGSFEALGMNGNICFDRDSRYGAYGLEADDYVGDFVEPAEQPDWKTVNWGELQNECLVANADRYKPGARSPTNMRPTADEPEELLTDSIDNTIRRRSRRGEQEKKYHTRTAVLIRSWEGYEYNDNDIQAIRAMVTELSLLSGGEYQVFLYVNVKDRNAPIWDDEEAYNTMLRKIVPKELRSIAVLWSEEVFMDWYPDVGDWQVYWHQFMPLQFFSKKYPEFDYIWNWETDARYTGQHYQFLTSIKDFARRQPRKFLSERNKRYYVPEIHGNWQEFFESTNAEIVNATAQGHLYSDDKKPIWGPAPYHHRQQPHGPTPPRSQEEDNFEWGVDEEADLITLLTMWDPRETDWSYKDKIWNFLDGVAPNFTPEDPPDDDFTHPGFKKIDRRVFINTVARFSKRMLNAMHYENKQGRAMQAEMWPATVALHHGMKAVYAPHPIWFDREWPARYTDLTFNAKGEGTGPGMSAGDVDTNGNHLIHGIKLAGWSERPDSPYNHDREWNFAGWSWYYHSRFAGKLYRRWLGWKVRIHEWAKPEQVVGGVEEEEGLTGWGVGGSRQGGESKKENGKRDLELNGPNRAEAHIQYRKEALSGRSPEASKKDGWIGWGPGVGNAKQAGYGKGRMCLPGMLLHPVKGMREGEVV